ncbi:YvcK family protein [Candidatus Kaiserbacteria bacterium]|nr:YvcK family protein [Candidatus Kaiserbacteria bacterium]
MKAKKRKHIVVIGGGTGSFTVLSGLKKYPVNLTAIVAMSDSGGSTGILRDELGVLPPGDVARCLVALSSSDTLMRTLMDYRFDNGNLKGHRFGNLLLSALEKMTGSFDSAVEKVSEILRIDGRVIPVTLDKVNLMAKVGKRIIHGEEKIQMTRLNGSLERIWLEPVARANPKALAAIRAADAIVIGPGGFYTGVVTNLLVRGIPEAIQKSKAKKIFVCNLMTKVEHTRDYSVRDYTRALEKYLDGSVDAVVYNNKQPASSLIKRYAREGDTLTSWDDVPAEHELIGANLLSHRESKFQKIGTPSKEASLVRHDPVKLAQIIAKIVGVKNGK